MGRGLSAHPLGPETGAQQIRPDASRGGHALAAVALTAAFAVTGCTEATGDPSTVVGRDHDASDIGRKYKTTVHDYDLTIKRADGSTYKTDVTSAQYRACPQDAAYPACANG